MIPVQKFCTECGTSLVPGTRYCGNCGHPVAGKPPDILTSEPDPSRQPPIPTGNLRGTEQIVGIVPFLEQGLFSVIHYNLIITSQRLIFCTWNPDTDEAMSDADDTVMQESCNIAETSDEITHFRKKDWTTGPWERYHSIPLDTIAAGAPGSIMIPLGEITAIDIVCETRLSTQDSLSVQQRENNLSFDLMYSQGPYLYKLIHPILGEKVSIADRLHKRGKLDRLLSGQEYR
jgi:hypothetical protein